VGRPLDEERLYRFLRRFADIRPDESRPALYLFLHFFMITFAFYIVKAVKESYQISVNERLWGGFDLGTAVLIGFVVAVNARLLSRLPRRKYLSRTIIFFVVSLLVFGFIFDLTRPDKRTFFISALLVFVKAHKNVFIFLFSFWSDIFIAMSVTQFWITVNDVFNLHQAKRLVGFLVTGGLLGGIGGNLLALALVHRIGPTGLLLVCPGVLLVTLVIVKLSHDEQERIRGKPETYPSPAGKGAGYLESLRTVRRDRYLRILAGLLGSAAIVGQFINYQFKFVVKAQEWNDSARASFVAMFFLGILVLSMVFHLVTTGHVLKRFGIRPALLAAPVVLVLGVLPVFALTAAAVTTVVGTAWACGLRGADKTFDNTLSQSVRELLYIPIHADIKYKAKIFIDMFVNKFSLGFGAVIYWIIYEASSFPLKSYDARVKELGIFVIGFALIWIVLIPVIYAEYLGAVKRDLLRKWQDAHKVVQTVDVDAAGLLVDTIQSREKSPALYYMNLFDIVRKGKLTPELLEILALKEDEVRARSMDALLDVGGEIFYPGEAIADMDIATQIPEVMALPAYKALIEKQLSDIGENKMASEAARLEAAKLIGLIEPTPGVFHALGRLLQDPSPEVLNYALGSAAVHLQRDHVPLIIPLLGNQMTKQVAQSTLAAYGPRIVDNLRKHLHNAGEQPAVRKAIPEVLARFGNQEAADILVAELALDDEALEQELIDALYKIRSNQPKVHFKGKRIVAKVLSLISRNYEAYLAAAVNRPAGDPTGSAPDRKAGIDIRTKRIFDLLTLICDSEDINKAYQNILQGTKKSVDYSLELLDNIVDRDLKTYLFPLIEDLSPDERVRRLRKLAKSLDRASL
jgi:AAA family ATP:ADP antiporter